MGARDCMSPPVWRLGLASASPVKALLIHAMPNSSWGESTRRARLRLPRLAVREISCAGFFIHGQKCLVRLLKRSAPPRLQPCSCARLHLTPPGPGTHLIAHGANTTLSGCTCSFPEHWPVRRCTSRALGGPLRPLRPLHACPAPAAPFTLHCWVGHRVVCLVVFSKVSPPLTTQTPAAVSSRRPPTRLHRRPFVPRGSHPTHHVPAQ
jgi:hypothetical protein